MSDPVIDPRDADAITEEHLEDVTNETIQGLVEGANFVVECPECEGQWVLAVDPIYLCALSNTYGDAAIESRFRKIARDISSTDLRRVHLHRTAGRVVTRIGDVSGTPSMIGCRVVSLLSGITTMPPRQRAEWFRDLARMLLVAADKWDAHLASDEAKP